MIEYKSHMKKLSFEMQTTQELYSEWVNILKNEALVAALLLTQTCRGMDPNIRKNEVDYAKVNVWGDYTHSVINTAQMLITICSACCILSLGSAIGLLRQLSLMPTKHAKTLILSLGQSVMGLGLVAITVALCFFAIFMMLVFSVTSDAWVGYFVISSYIFIIFVLPGVLGTFTANFKKDALLWQVYENPQYNVDIHDPNLSMFWGFHPGEGVGVGTAAGNTT